MKSIAPHLIAFFIFLAIPLVYFSPVIQGKVLSQSDVRNYEGMAKEIKDFKEATGEQTLWTNSMFGGMPAYLILVRHSGNIIGKAHRILSLNDFKPVSYVFLGLISFYILLLCFGVNPYLSIIGAFAYAFSSYFFIIIEAGHLTKAIALGYMPGVFAGVYLAFKERKILGALIFGFFLALQLITSHYQIVYYTLLMIIVFGIYKFVYTIKDKTYKDFSKSMVFLVIAAMLAVGTNAGNLLTTYEYGKDSMRGKSELTHNEGVKTSGLDKDYATAWSYDIDETLTLLIPNFKGGSSHGELSKDSKTYEVLKNSQGAGFAKKMIKQLPLYWGTQRFTSGPVYVGAFLLFLFVLGIFILKGRTKWWLITITVFSILLAWGRNFMPLTDLFLDYFPGYNKFRTVSMILIIAEFAIPLMAMLTIKKIIDNKENRKELIKYLKYSLYIVGGICLFFIVFGKGLFSFDAQSDQGYISQGAQFLVDALKEDRATLLRNDAFRSLLFILAGTGTIIAFLFHKIKLNVFYALIAFIIVVDLWPVNKRYIDNDDFVNKKQAVAPFTPTRADEYILQDKDPDFRVLNVAVNTFNDASTSYFHKSIGGYHGAKMQRYQELIDFHISKNNMAVLNMLNTKYFIVPTKDQGPIPQQNPEALGNSWFVNEIIWAENADDQIEKLTEFDPQKQVVIDKRWENQIEGFSFSNDSAASITLSEYKPNYLKYDYNSSVDQIAVFSEIFYDKGWIAKIDEKESDHFRCNYVLRGMVVPKGKHIIEFSFEPKSYHLGNKIALTSSIIFILLALGYIVYIIKRKQNISNDVL